jgi:hypothetical protein
MRKFVRNLISTLSPWYDEGEAKAREEHTAKVTERADKTLHEAYKLLDSYRAAGKVVSTWRVNGHA